MAAAAERYVHRTRISLGRAVRTAYRGTTGEFEDGKARPHLGVVVKVEVGAKKGGAVYEVADAKDKKHLVYAKNKHAVYPSDPMTKPGTPPAEVLDDYLYPTLAPTLPKP